MTAKAAFTEHHHDLSLQSEEAQEQAHAAINQRQQKLKQFLQLVAKDEAVCTTENGDQAQSLTDFLLHAQYPLHKHSMRSETSIGIDMAELVSLLLQRAGSSACYRQLMNHVLEGGSIADFLKKP